MPEETKKKSEALGHFKPLALIDVRGWSTIGMFAMVFYILHLIAAHPELANNELFKTVATILIGSGGFGLCCAFIWGGSKGSAHAMEAVSELAKANSAPSTTTITATPAGSSAQIGAGPAVTKETSDESSAASGIPTSDRPV